MMNYCHAVKMLCGAVLLFTSGLHSAEDGTTKKFAQGLVRGSIAGVLEVAIDQPLVTIKNDWQQGKKASFKLSHLYRGFGVNAGSMAPITAVQMSFYELFKHGLQDENSQSLPDNKKLLAATLSGSVSAGVSSPSELLMIQQQKNKATLGKTMNMVIKVHGPKVFLRGIAPTMFRDGGFTAGYLAGGPALSDKFIDAGLPEPLATVAGGTCAGLIAAGVTHPADTTKTKLQADLAKKYYKNAWDVFTKEGIRELYAGFTPRATRVVMATIVMGSVKKLEEIMLGDQ